LAKNLVSDRGRCSDQVHSVSAVPTADPKVVEHPPSPRLPLLLHNHCLPNPLLCCPTPAPHSRSRSPSLNLSSSPPSSLSPSPPSSHKPSHYPPLPDSSCLTNSTQRRRNRLCTPNFPFEAMFHTLKKDLFMIFVIWLRWCRFELVDDGRCPSCRFSSRFESGLGEVGGDCREDGPGLEDGERLTSKEGSQLHLP
jgi:hypothetical protein